MKILIAESGSTNTDWVLIEDGHRKNYVTDGLNPYFSSEIQITEVIRDQLLLEMGVEANGVKAVHYYGAGCGSQVNRNVIERALANHFKGASIEVRSDLLAAAHACFGNEEGVACILGTGSNSGLYDGNEIVKKIPSLGYALGDEGSGAYFGKQILNHYFYGTLPPELSKVLEGMEDMNLDHILDKVYKQPNGNRFVASFSELLGDFSTYPFIQNMIHKGFEAFVDRQLAYFGDLSGKEIGFVGSLAAYYQRILEEVLEERGLKLKVVLRNPTDKLVDYHLKKVSTL